MSNVMMVKDLSRLAEQRETTTVSKLGEITVAEGGLKLNGHDDMLVLDESALNLLGKYLAIPTHYLNSVPPVLQEECIKERFQKWPQSEVAFRVLGDSLISVHKPTSKIIPLKRVIEKIQVPFQPDDQVVAFNNQPTFLQVDILSGLNKIEVPGLGTSHRPMHDITHGGIRTFLYPGQSQVPVVQSYLHRLVCSNGMSINEPEYEISLRGNTVEEVLAEMGRTFETLLGNLPQRLEAYRASSEVPAPDDIASFIYHLARERNISGKVLDAVINQIPTLPEKPSVYDVLQTFTNVANGDVRYNTKLRLQHIGGDLAVDTAAMVNRCGTCQHPLGH